MVVVKTHIEDLNKNMEKLLKKPNGFSIFYLYSDYSYVNNKQMSGGAA